MLYTFSRLSSIEVYWANLFDANGESFNRFHNNPFCELIVIADGVVHLQVEGEKLRLESGQSLLLMPWERHQRWNHTEKQGQFFWAQFTTLPAPQPFVADQPHKVDIVQLQSNGLRTMLGNIEEPIIIPRLFRNSSRYKLFGLFEQLVETLTKPKGYFRFHATLLMGEILRVMANDLLEQSETDTSFPLSYATFRKLVNHLNNVYEDDRNLSRDILERVTDRKYEYLCQIFKKYTGITILSYIHQLRIQQAKHWLTQTETTVRDIGLTVGYQDSFYFSHVFKKYEGISPQQYRLAQKEG